jgi:Cu/Ag efflux pump CusA
MAEVTAEAADAPRPGRLGLSGRIAERFQNTEITPLLALVGLLLGLFAILVTPREEEPQINVTFADVFIPFPGASASEIEHLVAGPAEQVLSEIKGVKHIYSVSRPGMAVITVQFRVGEDRTDAIVRLSSKIRTGSSLDGGIVVLSGLSPGEQVALDPIAAGVALKRQADANRQGRQDRQDG